MVSRLQQTIGQYNTGGISLASPTARYFGNNWTAERTQYSITCPSSIPAARNTRSNAMTQIIPATRSDDSKFSWSRSGHFLTPDTYPRACFHFLTRAVRIARVDPAERFSRRLGSSGYRFSRRLAATRLLYRHRRSHHKPQGAACAGIMRAAIRKHA